MRSALSAGAPTVVSPPPAALTEREIEVLALIADGCENREIAGILGLAEETVKSYVERILTKLGAVHRAHAVAIRFARG
jgi:DNA-binding CsgD family transcriptional regulator